MGTTLEHGVYLPDEGERNCYAGLKVNWETLDQKIADISALQSAIAGALHREIVASLPTTDIDPNTIYMILSGTSATENIYDEYMYISNAWELIGTSATDLTNYYTKAEVDGKLLLKANASDLNSHTGDTTIHVTANDKSKWDTVALIKQLRLVNTQVGSATTIAFANIDDTNGIKVGDKCMDLDAKLFEITAVDTTNETVTVGSALIDMALDANVMHLSGNETASGFKTFDRYIQCNGGYIGNEASTNARTELVLRSNRDTAGQSGLIFTKFRQNKAQGALSGDDVVYLTLDLLENSIRTNGIFRFNFRDFVNDVPQDIAFFPTGSKNSLGGPADGSSNNKWHLFNGINPGALSLPDLSNGIDISGYINTGDSDNSYTPLADGYISVRINSTNGCALYALQGNVCTSSYGNIADVDLGGFFCSFFIPVVKNVACRIVCRRAQTIVSAKFFPCQGNV